MPMKSYDFKVNGYALSEILLDRGTGSAKPKPTLNINCDSPIDLPVKLKLIIGHGVGESFLSVYDADSNYILIKSSSLNAKMMYDEIRSRNATRMFLRVEMNLDAMPKEQGKPCPVNAVSIIYEG